MINKRNTNLEKYGISSSRYKELCGYCEQYPEWKNELNALTVIKGIAYSDLPKSKSNLNLDQTQSMAIRRADIENKCKLIEEVAKEADEYFATFLIKNICYRDRINYLITVKGMPCSTRAFIDKKRYFFYLLSLKK